MKKTEASTIVQNMDKNITEWVTRGANGTPYCTYQKRITGAKAGG